MKDYKKILEGVVNIINTTEKSDIGFANICTYIGENCPELAESKDERIRKDIISHFTKGIEGSSFDEVREKYKIWIAWIEKQGEHAKFIDSIQVGDKVTRNEDGMLVNLSQLNRVAKKDEKQGEQKPWSEDDQSNFNELSSFILETYRAEDASRLITWLNDIKDRVQLQPKQEWSEEDERIRQDIENLIHFALEDGSAVSPAANTTKEGAISWIQSLKHRYAWKPSGEQMDALETAVSSLQSTALESLYQDLKRL